MPTHQDETLLERYQREHLVYEGMNMSKHTDGPIRYEYEPGYCGELIAVDGMTVCAFTDEPSPENARRLVAAWNACDGISTDTLELVPRFTEAGIKTVQSVEAERDSLRAVNAELLAALERSASWADSQADAQSKGGHATFDLMALREERDSARAAIARATAQANTEGQRAA
jgi:hypothetical protein